MPVRTLLAIGETMAMVAPVEAGPVADAEVFLLDAGGAESNVAAHVAALGHRAVWFSRLGADALGRRVAGQLARRDVDVSRVVFDDLRPTGLYVKDPGSGVLYFRRGSAASALSEADADAVSFAGVDLLHVSGITAAISASASSFLSRVIERAREHGVPVSFDVNHRPALQEAATAAPVLLDLARRADIVFTGRDEAEGLWGTGTAADVRALLPDVPELVVKDGSIGATAYTDVGEVFEPALVVEVVEAVGAGDAFAGGYLAGRLDGEPVAARLRAGHERAARTLQTTTDSIDEGDARMSEDQGAWFEAEFAGAPLMAILRGMGVERSVRLAETAWDLGIDSVEVPLQTDEDERALREVVARAGERGKRVGAGTVVTPAQVVLAADAGAAYVVSPGLDPVVVRAAREAGIPILPGVATPGEVQLAVALGLTWLKAFPATWLGSGWFRHLRGPFPQVRFVATGGLDASNVEEFLAAGVRVAAVGSALEDETQLVRLAGVLRARSGG